MSDDPFDGDATIAFNSAIEHGQKFGGSRYDTQDYYSTADIAANAKKRQDNAGFYKLRSVLDHVEAQFGKDWIKETEHPVASFLQQYAIPMGAGAANQFLRMAGAVSDLPDQTVKLDEDSWTMMGVGSMRAFKTNVGASELGIFGGINARGANKLYYNLAKEQAAAGVPPAEIFRNTNWVKFPDGQWRFEINDIGAQWKPGVLELHKKYELPKQASSVDTGWGTVGTSTEQTATSKFAVRGVPLEGLLDHPELYKHYPEAKQIKTTLEIGLGKGESEIKGRGMYDPANNHLYATGQTLDQAMSVALHEIQHFVQHKKELFAQGGDPRYMAKSQEAGAIRSELSKIDLELDKALKDTQVVAVKMKQVSDRILDIEKRGGDATRHRERWAEMAVEWDNLEAKRLALYKRYDEKYPGTRDPGFHAYRMLMGEVEARLVQTRQHMTGGERQKNFPIDQMDVKPQDQIRGGTFSGPMKQEQPPADPMAGRIPPTMKEMSKEERNLYAVDIAKKRIEYVRQGGDPTKMEGIDRTVAPYEHNHMTPEDHAIRAEGIKKVADQVESMINSKHPGFTVEKEISRSGTTYLVFKRDGKEPFEVRLADHADLKRDRLSIDPVTGNRPDDILRAFEYHYGFTNEAPTVGWAETKSANTKRGTNFSRQIGGEGKYMRIQDYHTPIKRDKQLFSVVPIGGTGDHDE